MAAALVNIEPAMRRAQERQAGHRRSAPFSGGAEILFFTGVRIERWSSDEAPAAPARDTEDAD